MGYEEYFDYIERAKTTGKYVIFAIDGEHFSRANNYALFYEKTSSLMKEMTKIFLSMEREDKILVRDENMILNIENSNESIWGRTWNPFFTAGDFVGFYFYRDKMDAETFKKVFYEACKITNNNFKYHLSSAYYETNSRVGGGRQLWCGYAFQYLANCKETRTELLNNKKR